MSLEEYYDRLYDVRVASSEKDLTDQEIDIDSGGFPIFQL
jgi:hypothetical protein